MRYRLSIDLGATSLGWSIFDIEKEQLIDVGVRIFDDGRENKTHKPLSVQRREARSARRLNQRHKIKMRSLVDKLTDIGLLPQNKNERKKLKDLNPYKRMSSDDPQELEKIQVIKRMPLYSLRAKALDERLELYEIGRILLQLGQRKGFLSNRKDNESTGGKLKKGNDRLAEEISINNARTYGEYLYKKHLEQPKEPIRLKNAIDDNKLKEGIAFPYRKDYKDEFNKIWDKQKEFYPDILTYKNKEIIEHILYWQRPLKAQEVGFCTLEPDEKRLPKAHPLFQEFRILQTINNLKISNNNLTEEQRSALLDRLMHPNKSDKTLTFDKIKKILKLEKNIKINYEITGDNTKGILVNSTERAIKNIGSDKLENFWNGLSSENKNDIVYSIMAPNTFFESKGNDAYQKAKTIEKQNEVILEFIEETYKLDKEIAEKLLYATFEEGYCNLSKKAVEKLLEHMRNGSRYDEACEEAGYHHSAINSTDRLDRLPYYGKILTKSCAGAKPVPKNEEEQYGRISNATVHVALNQVRILVNELLNFFGKPSEISIEYARDLSASTDERSAIIKKQNENKKENDKVVEKLKECGLNNVSRDDIDKCKILESQKWICVYCGKNFERNDLFNGTEVDHILPFSRTFDDSRNNKVVCCSLCNRGKKNRTPYEAFSNQEDWSKILERAEKLGKDKFWRFQENAMEEFEKRGGGLLGRSLNDTRYATKVLQAYLKPIMDPEGAKTVLSIRGQLTAMIRQALGLNSYKDKNDLANYRSQHQHHAIDAIAMAFLNRSMLNKIYEEIKKGASYNNHEDKVKDFIKKHVEIPGRLTPKDIYDLVSKINISHKPSLKNVKDKQSTKPSLKNVKDKQSTKPSLKNVKDKQSTIGELHEDTAYGRIDNDKIKTYVPKFYNVADRDAFFDAYKEWFIINGKSKSLETKDKKVFEEREKIALKKLQDCAQKAFKWFKGGNNYCIAIYEIQSNNKIEGLPAKNGGDWESEVVSNYNATVRAQRKECVSYLPYR